MSHWDDTLEAIDLVSDAAKDHPSFDLVDRLAGLRENIVDLKKEAELREQLGITLEDVKLALQAFDSAQSEALHTDDFESLLMAEQIFIYEIAKYVRQAVEARERTIRFAQGGFVEPNQLVTLHDGGSVTRGDGSVAQPLPGPRTWVAIAPIPDGVEKVTSRYGQIYPVKTLRSLDTNQRLEMNKKFGPWQEVQEQ